jgi:hypothetical protein
MFIGQRPRQNKMSADEAYDLLTRRQRQQQQLLRQQQRQQHRAQASTAYETQASESSGHETSDGNNTVYPTISEARGRIFNS